MVVLLNNSVVAQFAMRYDIHNLDVHNLFQNLSSVSVQRRPVRYWWWWKELWPKISSTRFLLFLFISSSLEFSGLVVTQEGTLVQMNNRDRSYDQRSRQFAVAALDLGSGTNVSFADSSLATLSFKLPVQAPDSSLPTPASSRVFVTSQGGFLGCFVCLLACLVLVFVRNGGSWRFSLPFRYHGISFRLAQNFPPNFWSHDRIRVLDCTTQTSNSGPTHSTLPIFH